MRQTFSDCIVELARAHPEVVMLTGDHGYALFDAFRKECPGQFINAGIAEQNMVGMAAGLARTGLRPFVYGLAAFIPVRVLEQIKLDIAHDLLPVILFGDGAGFVYSHLGTSHQSTEDIACARAIPNLDVFSPADRHELRACVQLAFASGRPSYIRMGKADLGDVHPGAPLLEAGSLLPVGDARPGAVAFIATGSLVKLAVDIAPQFGASVWSAPCIKPINEAQVAELCRRHAAVVVLEEHSVHGGLGSAIAEISASAAPLPVLRVGVQDRFSHACGTYDYLRKEHGLDRESVLGKIRDFLRTRVAR